MPLIDVDALSSGGIDTTISSGTIIKPGNIAAHTKGSYIEVIASTPWDAWGFMLQATYATSNIAVADYLVDIATGAAMSESNIVENVIIGTSGTRVGYAPAIFPLEIASGSRISMRSQGTGAAATNDTDFLAFSLVLFRKGDHAGASACVTYGANTADTGGVEVDPGASANTKGDYSEITAATSADINWLVVGVGNKNNGVRTSANWLLDIATGAALSEAVVVPDIQLGTSSTHDLVLPQWISVPVPTIASGTRLAARAACSIPNSTDRLIDVIVYGMNTVGGAGGAGGGAHILGGTIVR